MRIKAACNANLNQGWEQELPQVKTNTTNG